jgi:glycosyltransferase involved in cell wall biosynthesis
LDSDSKSQRVVIVKNHFPVETDPRVTKIIKILKSQNYNITYLGWNTDSPSLFSWKTRPDKKDYKEITMNGKLLLGYPFFIFPLWWIFETFFLLRLNWNVVHVVNFPSLFPAIIIAKLKKRKVVYDIEDTFIDQLPTKLSLLRGVGLTIDRLLMMFVNAVILVDEMQVEEFHGIPNKKVIVIYDSPFTITKSKKASFDTAAFKIFYAGRLGRGRFLNLDSMIKTVKEINGAQLIFAGAGEKQLVDELNLAASLMPEKIRYLGWVSYDKVLELTLEADLLFSLRDPNPPNQKYICGSKFLESVMYGKPMLVNQGTSAAIKVERHNCGIVVDAHDIPSIKNALLRLMHDKELCKQLGKNGKEASTKIYGWDKMKERLLDLYCDLTHL